MVKFREYLRGGIVSDRVDKKFKFDLEQERYFNSKYELEKSKDENIHNLQDSWCILNEVQSDLLEHVKRNPETELMLQRLEQIYVDVRIEMDDILIRLEMMGSHRNIELENRAFNYKIALKESDEYNPLLPNYIEILNRFANSVKKQNSNRQDGLSNASTALKIWLYELLGQEAISQREFKERYGDDTYNWYAAIKNSNGPGNPSKRLKQKNIEDLQNHLDKIGDDHAYKKLFRLTQKELLEISE